MFISTESFNGVYTNITRTLKDNSMCTVSIDATEAVARVIFDNDEDLGILYPDYVIGQPITVPKGETKMIVIYNGNSAGYLNYRLSFSGATQMVLSAASLLSMFAIN